MDCAEVLAWLEKRGSRRVAEGMDRYAIRSKLRVFGVPVSTLLQLKKRLGKDHALAQLLWSSGCYEARLLATLVDDSEQVTRRQMNAWAADFESWADCDSACFHLFDRTPFAWAKARQWSTSPREFVKRAAFALMASLTVHDKTAPDSKFLELLPLIEAGARRQAQFRKESGQLGSPQHRQAQP